MTTPTHSLPLVFGRAESRAVGFGERQISRLAGSGRWTRLRQGQFAVGPFLDEGQRWRAEVLAVARSYPRDLVLSHAHAARAWGLASPLAGWGRMSFTCAVGSQRTAPALIVRVAPLDDGDVRAMGRVRVTSPARTVADCARTLSGHDALAIADRALRVGLVSPLDLRQAVDRIQGWPGAVQARRVVDLADGRRETPLESWSGWSFDEQQLPSPVWQAVLCDDEGVFLGRVDAWWSQGVVGEADGRLKYRLSALERGGVSAEALTAVLDDERRREIELRRAGASVVRWAAEDVLIPSKSRALAEYLRAEIARAAAVRGFRGKVVTA